MASQADRRIRVAHANRGVHLAQVVPTLVMPPMLVKRAGKGSSAKDEPTHNSDSAANNTVNFLTTNFMANHIWENLSKSTFHPGNNGANHSRREHLTTGHRCFATDHEKCWGADRRMKYYLGWNVTPSRH